MDYCLHTRQKLAAFEISGDHGLLHCSVDIPAMFESKGVTKAAERLQLLVGDARESFPEQAKAAKVGQALKISMKP
jgi:hypothetical protein